MFKKMKYLIIIRRTKKKIFINSLESLGEMFEKLVNLFKKQKNKYFSPLTNNIFNF